MSGINDKNIRTLKLFDLEIFEPLSGFSTGTDAVLLSAFVKGRPSEAAVELGAGTGVVSLICAAKRKFSHIYSVEIQKSLFSLLVRNTESNGLSEKVVPVCADVRHLCPADFPKVTSVFANPPYMKVSSGKSSVSELRQISRHEVFGGVTEFCFAAAKLLKTGGRFYTVYRPDRLETLMNALKNSGFSPKRMTFVSSSGSAAPSCVLTEAVLNGRESLFVTPTLFLKSNESESPDAAYIYENDEFPDKFQKP